MSTEGLPWESPEEPEEPTNSGTARGSKEDPLSKAERIARESTELRQAVDSGVVTLNTKTRVASILNIFPHTRDSDVWLALKYWELYQPELFNRYGIEPRNLFKLERMTTLTRTRAKIQNEYGLFPASEEVRRVRRSREEEVKDAVVENKPQSRIASCSRMSRARMMSTSLWQPCGFSMVPLSSEHRMRSVNGKPTHPGLTGRCTFKS